MTTEGDSSQLQVLEGAASEMHGAQAALPMVALARRARLASRTLAQSSSSDRDRALWAAAAALRTSSAAILEANAQDLAVSQAKDSFRDRLTLTPERVEAMARGLEDIADLPDPVGQVRDEWTRPNGLRIRRVSTPVGVIGVIYESRPNVGADAAGLCIKSGNAVLLRGGSESLHSARAIHAAMQEGLRAAGLPEDAVLIAPDADRRHVADMLGAAGLVDLIIPRGGRGLVERVQSEARVPVLAQSDDVASRVTRYSFVTTLSGGSPPEPPRSERFAMTVLSLSASAGSSKAYTRNTFVPFAQVTGRAGSHSSSTCGRINNAPIWARRSRMLSLKPCVTISMATSTAAAKPSASVPPWDLTTTPFRPTKTAPL